MESSNPGGAALALVSALIAQLQLKGVADVEQIEQVLHLLKSRPIAPQQVSDVDDALAVVQGLKGIPPEL